MWSHCADGTWKKSTVIELGSCEFFCGLEHFTNNFSSREHLLCTYNNEIWGHDEKGCWRRKGKIPYLRKNARFLPCQSRLLLYNPIEKTEEIWEIFPSGKTVEINSNKHNKPCQAWPVQVFWSQ